MGGYAVTELVSIFFGCLGLYTLANFIRSRAERDQWVKSYLILVACACWLALGLVYALLMLGIGQALILALRYRQGERDFRPSLRTGALTALALLVAALLAALLSVPVPFTSTTHAPALLLALLAGAFLTRVVDLRLSGRTWPPRRQLYGQIAFSLVFSLLAIYLTPTIFSTGPVLFILVMAMLAGQVAFFQEAEQTQDSLNRRTQEITLLHNLSQFMPSDLDELLATIYLYVKQLLDLSIFYIATYDEEREALDFRLVMLRGEQVHWASRHLGDDSAAERVLRMKQALRFQQAEDMPELPADAMNSSRIDYLGVPMMVAGNVVGIMAIVSASGESLEISDIHVLQTVASQVALVVRNATLYRRQTELVEKLSQINTSVHQILFNPNRDNALEAACPTAAAIANSDKVAIFLRQDDCLHLKTAYGLTETHRHWLYEHPLPLCSERVLVSTTAEQDTWAAQSEAGAFQAVAEIPLRTDKSILGMLAVYYDAPHSFRPRELDLLATLANQITAMLENARLFNVMEGYAAEMSQLIQLSRISTSSLNLTQVLRDIAEALQQMANVSRVTIFLFENEAKRVRLLASVNGDPASIGSEGSIATAFPELAQLINDSARQAYQHSDAGLSEAIREQMEQHQEQTIALVPLVLENTVLGAVVLGSQQTRHFAEREWQFIELATNQISAQINNIKLHEKALQDLNRRLAQIAVIEDVAQQVSSSLNFNTVIQHVLAAAMNATDADLVSMGLVTDNEQFWIMERRVAEGRPLYRYMAQAIDQGVLGTVRTQRRTLIVPDNTAAAHYISDYPGVYRSSIGVPLFKEDAVIGVLNAESTRLNAFQPEHASFLSRLAGHAVISIENARFLEARQREIDMLQSLRELAVWLMSADDTDSVAQQILETAVQLLEGKGAILYQVDADGAPLKPMTSLTFGDGSAPAAEGGLAQQVAQEAAASGEVHMLSDLSQHPAYQDSAKPDYASLLAIPLKRGQQVQHVMLISFDSRRMLQEHDRNTIDLLDAQAVGHLENAELHERIRSGRDQMRAILNSTQDGMILLDREANLIETNPSAHRLLGIDLASCIGCSFPETLQAERQNGVEVGYTGSDLDSLLKTLHDSPETETHQDITRVVDGQVIHIEQIGLPVRDADRRIIGRLLVLRDVTRAKLLEEQREDFSDMVVHDLRGPLGSIQNALDLALAHVGEPESKEVNAMLMHASKENVGRLMGLVETLLDIARMQSPDMVLDCEPVSLQALVETAHRALTSSIEQANLHFIQEIPPDLPDVYVDRDKIVRVLVNLLDNAIRYTSVKGDVMIAARVLEPGKLVEVRVSDSGPGIPVDMRDSIFDRFQRVPGQKPARGHKGHGLGLNFTRQAIEKHGGSIHIADDGELSGACFAFTLPIHHSPLP